MVEWDDAIPEFEVVYSEVNKAIKFAEKGGVPNNLPNFSKRSAKQMEGNNKKYSELLSSVQEAIISGDSRSVEPEKWIINKEDFPPEKQLDVYTKGYRHRLFDITSEDLPILRCYLGDGVMNDLLNNYVEGHVSSHPSVSKYVCQFPKFIRQQKNILRDYNFEFSCELALLEAELCKIFDMEESKELNVDKFREMNPAEFMDAKILPRKALKLLNFEYPVNSYYQAVLKEEKPSEPDKKKTYLAVYRHNDSLLRLELEEEEYVLLEHIFMGNNIGESLQHLISNDNFDIDNITNKLDSWFSKWVSNGILADSL